MKKMRSGEKLQGKKQGRVCYVSSTRKPKAVDEDLYKIPPELLYQLPKRVYIYIFPLQAIFYIYKKYIVIIKAIYYPNFF